MSKHTPGPWKYWHEEGYVGELNAPNGTLIAAFESEPSEANARLIAAAPDLLEALKEIVYWYQVRDKNENPLPVHNQNPEIKQAIEAIAKATGEQA